MTTAEKYQCGWPKSGAHGPICEQPATGSYIVYVYAGDPLTRQTMMLAVCDEHDPAKAVHDA